MLHRTLVAAAAAAQRQGCLLARMQQQQQLCGLAVLTAAHHSHSSSSLHCIARPILAAAAAAGFSTKAAAAAAGEYSQKPGAAFLASLIDYEKLGIPTAAGVAGSSSSSTSTSSSSNPPTNTAAAVAVNRMPTGSSSNSRDTNASKFDLQKMHSLLAAMDNPHHKLKVVHVAGTKGKGSVVVLLSAILRAAGLQVGTYTSPHMFSIRERIVVGVSSSSSSDTVAAAAAAAPVTENQWECLALQAQTAVQNMQQQQQQQDSIRSSSSSMPSHFEVVTAMAFQHFAQQRVDIAVIETGLGGATDATNVFSPQQLQAAVLTAVGLDHVDALGGSLTSIAAAKAGIMKQGVPVVVGPQQQQQQGDTGSSSSSGSEDQAGIVWDVFRRTAHGLQCPLVVAEDVVQVSSSAGCPPISILQGTAANLARQTLDITADTSALPQQPPQAAAAVNNPQQQQQQQQQPSTADHSSAVVVHLSNVDVQLVGRHQSGNVATAVATALLLQQRGWKTITPEAIRLGLQQAWLPGRFQVAELPSSSSSSSPCHVVLDGAHTRDSAAALAATVRAAFPDQPLVLLLAMAADKQLREVCQALRGARPSVVIFTSVPIAGSTSRAAPPGALAAHWQAAAMLSPGRPLRCRELIQANLGAALEKARHELRAYSGKGGVVLVTGSLHAVAAAMKQLNLD